MFAVIKSGGRQYKVSVGQTFEVNRLPVEAGAQVTFEEVLLISDADRTMLGTPLLDNALVLATAIRQARGEKLIVFRYKPKKRQRHRRGHRQEITIVTIDDIVANGKSLITGEAPRLKSQTEEVSLEAEEQRAEATEAPASVSETPTTDVPSDEPQTTRRRRVAKAEDSEDAAADTENKAEDSEDAATDTENKTEDK